MITKENFRDVLKALNFREENKDCFTRYFEKANCSLKVDFRKEILIYPEEKGLKVNDKTTSNFSHDENFVVFECVARLFEKGYSPEHLELEPKWQLGRDGKSGKADILVYDKEKNPYIIIECKTTDEKNSEFEREWQKMNNEPSQLISYFQQEKSVKFLCLYSSDFNGGKLNYYNYILNVVDNDAYLKQNKFTRNYKSAGSAKEIFEVWTEIYKNDYSQIGIFEKM